MFLQRNVASQVFVLPGTLRDLSGSAVTSGAAVTWVKDGTSGAGAGVLTHVTDGGYTYAPTQGETDAAICGWVLTKSGAVGLAGSVRTTNADPNNGTSLGLSDIDTNIASRAAASGVKVTQWGTTSVLNSSVNGLPIVSLGALSPFAGGEYTFSATQNVNADLWGNLSPSVGVTLAASQGNYAPSKAGDAMALVTDALTSTSLAASATAEIQAAVTGGAYALNTDSGGNVKVSDGTGANQIDTTLGAIAHVVLTDTTTTLTNAPSDSSGTTTLLSRLTATRAGYLDNLSAGAVATAAAIAALNNLSASQVKTQMVAALATDTYAEPGQGNPPATDTLANKIGYLAKAWRNKKTQTADTFSLYNDGGSVVDQKSTVSDDGTTATFGQLVTGP